MSAAGPASNLLASNVTQPPTQGHTHLYTETCQVLLMFLLDFDQVLVGIFNPFQRLWML